jgi:hypothetical protein
MKKCSPFLAINEMQIKTTLREIQDGGQNTAIDLLTSMIQGL